MSGDIVALLELEKKLLLEDKKRLGLIKEDQEQDENCDHEHQRNNNQLQSAEDKENQPPLNPRPLENHPSKNLPLIQELDLSNNNEASLEENKQAFNDKNANAECPFPFRSDDPPHRKKMLRYGEYSPNNPQLKVTAAAAPYLGLGEYEQRRNLFLQRQRADYLEHLSKVQHELQLQRLSGEKLSPYYSNSVMQNNRNLPSYCIDQKLTSAQNALLKADMDKPKSILSNRRTGSPRERHTSYGASFLDGFSYQEDRADELERERIKRDNYQRELRLQIEEKRRIQTMREDQERREQELENRRLEQQLLRMQEEQLIEDQRWNRRDNYVRRHSNSEDLLRRKQDLQSRGGGGFRKHTDSESSVISLRNTNVASKAVSHYSPPVSRRNPYSFNIPSTSVFCDSPSTSSPRYNPSRFDSYCRKDALNRMDSLNTYDNTRFNAFSRYDSLSRIDSLNRQDTLNRIESLNIQDSLSNVQRRHSATQQDLSMLRRSPKLQRRSSSSRFDDTLPIPVLKAHSPVAKELKNSVPFNSSRHSDAVRKLEDKWQIPAVQKNIINHGDSLRDGQGRSILTQLGAIRMQLQQEQLRMDENLRKRDFTQSKAVDFH